MKTKTIKVVSVLLMLAVLITSVPLGGITNIVSAFSDEENIFAYSIENNEVSIDGFISYENTYET